MNNLSTGICIIVHVDLSVKQFLLTNVIYVSYVSFATFFTNNHNALREMISELKSLVEESYSSVY